MGKITIQNPDINEWITDNDVEYHIGKNFKIESDKSYAWNIYRKTDQRYFIGTLHMDRHTIQQSNGGKMITVMVKKDGIQKEVYKCWVGIGLIKDKKALIGVVRGCVRMNQI
jgi:hypothetical protein